VPNRESVEMTTWEGSARMDDAPDTPDCTPAPEPAGDDDVDCSHNVHMRREGAVHTNAAGNTHGDEDRAGGGAFLVAWGAACACAFRHVRLAACGRAPIGGVWSLPHRLLLPLPSGDVCHCVCRLLARSTVFLLPKATSMQFQQGEQQSPAQRERPRPFASIE
jgi:hypothetical protein